MKVLYFSQDYTAHDHRFLQALAGTDHRVAYLRLQDAGRALEERSVPERIEVIDWWGGSRPVEPAEYQKAARELGTVLDRWQPDLVHAGPIQSCTQLAADAGAHPLLAMSWGSDLLLDAREGEGRELAASALARSEVLVCDCQAVRTAAIELGFPGERIVVFPWGVDLQHFSPVGSAELRERLTWQEQFVLLSTRSWEPHLGIVLLLSAFLEAAAEIEQLRLILLGAGTLGTEIQEQIAGSGVADRVHCPGLLSYEQLPDVYRSADLYLSASHVDGSSVSLMEAMASGKASLVSDIPGNREWIQDGANGWSFVDGDQQAMAAGMRSAWRARGELTELGRSARETAEARADWSRNFPKLLEAYRLARSVHRGAR